MFHYKKVEALDIPDMIKLYKIYLNDGEIIDEQITKDFYTDGFIGIKCVDEHNKMIGVVSAFPGVEFTCGHEALVEEIKALYKGHCIYTTEMIVVIPEFRHLNIGEQMINHFHVALDRTKADYFITELWKEPSGRVPGRLITNILGGEVKHYSIPLFYEALASYGLTCPICGDTCVCGAEISIIDLHQEGRVKSYERSKEKIYQC